MEFTKWSDLCDHIESETGLRPYRARGICVFSKDGKHRKSAVILRSVAGTPYYNDEFVGIVDENSVCYYTLEGKSGDQDTRTTGNVNLCIRAERIYLYRVMPNGRYLWLGEYERMLYPLEVLRHPGEDGVERTMYRIALINSASANLK